MRKKIINQGYTKIHQSQKQFAAICKEKILHPTLEFENGLFVYKANAQPTELVSRTIKAENFCNLTNHFSMVCTVLNDALCIRQNAVLYCFKILFMRIGTSELKCLADL